MAVIQSSRMIIFFEISALQILQIVPVIARSGKVLELVPSLLVLEFF
jgi:hypothetical protein